MRDTWTLTDLRRKPPPHFLIRDDVLYIRPLEWNTTQRTFYGFPVLAWVEVIDCLFKFPNGYLVGATMPYADHPESYEMEHCAVHHRGVSSPYWPLLHQDGGNFVRLLVSVARREPYRPGDTWERPRYREDAPLPPGVGEERRIVCYRAAGERRFVRDAGASGAGG